jgi:trigger factor
MEGIATEQDADDEGAEEKPEKLNLEVKIDKRGACQRHITVTIPREDIERYFENAFSDLVGKAAVPGFRPGRAPRKLVENRFRKDVADQVKGSLLMDSLAQITEDEKLAAISEPDLDPSAVSVPDEGAMTYEFDLEVRPEFDLPNWKGLTVEQPVREFTDKDVDERLKNVLAQHGNLAPHDGPAEVGDYVTVNLSFRHGETEISRSDEEVIRIRPVLSFRDGRIEGFDKLMKGVKAGETRTGKAKLSPDAPNATLRGQEVTAVFEVLEVKKLELPELTPQFLQELGEFESEEELRQAVRESLERRLEYAQQQRARQQVTAALVESANWELPPDMLRRQAVRELERSVLELRRSGFSDQEIQAHANDLRQNSMAATARALKEHFILERIAEEEKIEETPADYENEIRLIAAQSGESVRRVRAQMEKRGLMDSLRNQIIERKTIGLILEHAKFKEVPYQLETAEAEAIDQTVGGGDEPEIPEAQAESQRAHDHDHDHGHDHDHDHGHGHDHDHGH